MKREYKFKVLVLDEAPPDPEKYGHTFVDQAMLHKGFGSTKSTPRLYSDKCTIENLILGFEMFERSGAVSEHDIVNFKKNIARCKLATATLTIDEE